METGVILSQYIVCACPLEMLGEHLQEIRALRLRLEESIRTNDRLREQLEKKLAEVERDAGRPEIGFCSWFDEQAVAA